MEPLNRVRGFGYMLGVFQNQQNDPFCRSCNSYATVLSAMKEGISKFETENEGFIKGLDERFSRLFAEAKAGIMAIKAPENPLKQKKEGNCRLPEGVCFLKNSMAILQKTDP